MQQILQRWQRRAFIINTHLIARDLQADFASILSGITSEFR
jgi:hypothetical protein